MTDEDTSPIFEIVPWGVQSLDSDDIDYWQGRLESDVVEEAVSILVSELH